MESLDFAMNLSNRLDAVWTFLLLLTRYTGLFIVLPGIGGGERGLVIRIPAVVVLTFATFNPLNLALIPSDNLMLLGQLSGEFLLGFAVGLIPFMLIAGVQTAGQLATTSMGLSAGNLIDPTLGVMTTDLSRLLGDLTVVAFLLVGGHHVAIQAVSGLGGLLTPGQFAVNPQAAELLIDRSADIFRVGVLLSAPILVAMLLTNAVMGLISKAVPSVNIFVVSFPLTIGVGLILTIVALPEVVRFVGREFTGIENSVLAVTRSARAPGVESAGQSFDTTGQTGDTAPLSE